MSKTLKVWNGRGYACAKYDDPRWKGNYHAHANVCAYSRADAAKVIEEYLGGKARGLDREIKNYWSPVWGNSMNGINKERGLWIEFERGVPTRVA